MLRGASVRCAGTGMMEDGSGRDDVNYNNDTSQMPIMTTTTVHDAVECSGRLEGYPSAGTRESTVLLRREGERVARMTSGTEMTTHTQGVRRARVRLSHASMRQRRREA